MNRIHRGGFGLVVVVGSRWRSRRSGRGWCVADDRPLASTRPRGCAGRGGGATSAVPAPDPAVKPLMDGPLHEAFLSPRKDQESDHVAKAPPSADHRAPRR